jgi:hypothetical protein
VRPFLDLMQKVITDQYKCACGKQKPNPLFRIAVGKKDAGEKTDAQIRNK